MIASQECWYEVALPPRIKDVRALGRITMELMQKYDKDNGAIGIEDLDRWPSDSNAVAFLSTTTSAASVTGLMKVSGNSVS